MPEKDKIMLLEFDINKQNITRVDCNEPVADSMNYLYAHFNFKTPEWLAEDIKSVNFWRGKNCITQLIDENNLCLVPYEIIKKGYIEVSCFAGNLITNDKAKVKIKESGYKQGETPLPPTEDVYNQILALVNETRQIAQSVRADADAGVFDGPPGPAGPQGPPGEPGTSNYLELLHKPRTPLNQGTEEHPVQAEININSLPNGKYDVYNEFLLVNDFHGRPPRRASILVGESSMIFKNNIGTLVASSGNDNEFASVFYIDYTNYDIDNWKSVLFQVTKQDVEEMLEDFATLADLDECAKYDDFTLNNGFSVLPTGVIAGATKTKEQYDSAGNGLVISKGTLENLKTKSTDNFDEADDISIPTTLAVSKELSNYTTKEYVDRAITDVKVDQGIRMYTHGNPTIKMGIASGFTTNDYLEFPKVVTVDKPFELKFAITTGNELINQQNIIDSNFGLALAIQNSKLIIALSSNGTSWDIGAIFGTYILQPNTPYFIKINWDGTTYRAFISTDGSNYIEDITRASSLSLYPRPMFVGVGNLFFEAPKNYFKGSIDFNEAFLYLEDEEIWRGVGQNFASNDLLNITDKGIEVIRDTVKVKSIIDMTNHNTVETRLKLDVDITESGLYILQGTGWLGIPNHTENTKMLHIVGGETRLILNNEADLVTIYGDSVFNIEFRNITNAYDWREQEYAKLSLVNSKQDKSAKDIDLESTSANITITDNKIFKRGTLATLDIELPTLTVNDDYLATLIFKSGASATAFNYPYDTKWIGDDLSNGKFAPAANKSYTLMFNWDGYFWTAIVNGKEETV